MSNSVSPNALEHLRDDRTGLRRLPRPVGLTKRNWPLDVQVNARSHVACAGKHDEGGLEYAPLKLRVSGKSERVAVGKLNTEQARGQLRLAEVRHHRHDDGRDTRCLDVACQHGHVAATIRSDGREDDTVDPVTSQHLDDLGSRLVTPNVKSRRLIPHDRNMVRCRAPDDALRNHRV